MHRDFYYPSKDKETSIHAQEWKPEGKVRAILQIVHGMCEYVGRYAGFAQYLCDRGYLVIGNDHLGHGESVAKGHKHGYFCAENGNECLIADIHALRVMTEERYPGVPYFFLGHSMGSFLTRQYLMMHGSGLAGAIIMGTGSQSGVTLAAGKAMARMNAKRNGWDSVSASMDKTAFGSYNKGFTFPGTYHDWLTKDKAILDSYEKDPWCSFSFTMNGYYNMFLGIEYIQKKENIARIPKNLPLLLVSGQDDPVGHKGKDVPKIYNGYKKAGLNVRMKLYPNDRHEILNETEKETVMSDLYQWLESNL